MTDAQGQPLVQSAQQGVGEAVYDPFVDRGTTLIGVELTGRVCVAMEIDRRYCDVTTERWQPLTGATAGVVGNQRLFADAAAARAIPAPSWGRPGPAAWNLPRDRLRECCIGSGRCDSRGIWPLPE